MIDHIIYAAPDLDAAVIDFTRSYGVLPTPGGRHTGFGTRNALVGLREGMYLEIMAIDPEQDVSPDRRFFGLSPNFAPRFAGWCARAPRPLEETVAIARNAGTDLGDIFSMSRARPDGSVMAWTLSSPFATREGGVLPFYIDWGDAPNPAFSLHAQLTLVALTVMHPEPARIRTVLETLGEDRVQVEWAPEPSLAVALR